MPTVLYCRAPLQTHSIHDAAITSDPRSTEAANQTNYIVAGSGTRRTDAATITDSKQLVNQSGSTSA